MRRLTVDFFLTQCQPSWITQIYGGGVRISRASRVATILALGLHALPALAELPLTVEDLVTDKGKFKLDASFSYANVDRNGVSAGEPIQVQTGPTSFVQVPTAVGERSSNRDTLVGTMGLRYGITKKTEVLARTSYLHTSERVRENDSNIWASIKTILPILGWGSTTSSGKRTIIRRFSGLPKWRSVSTFARPANRSDQLRWDSPHTRRSTQLSSL